MRKRVIICCLVIATGFTGTACFGQTKFLTWFRQRIGERKAKDADQAKSDAQWQKEHFADSAAQEKLVAAFKKSRCNTCHLKGKKKTERNVFGIELSKLLRDELKMNAKEITAALKTSAPEEIRLKAEEAFFGCLDKALKANVKPDDEESETYGDRLKRGELPAAP